MTFFRSTVPSDVRLRIAYLEDDLLLAQEVMGWLREAGYDVRHYADSQEFARAVEHGGVDALLLDWMVPGLNGTEVLCRLRLQLGAKTPPVIFLTARNGEADVVEAPESGADDYLIKPLSRAVLLARLQAVLRRSGGYCPRRGCTSVTSKPTARGGRFLSRGGGSSSPTAKRIWRCIFCKTSTVCSPESTSSRPSGGYGPTSKPARSTCMSARCGASSTCGPNPAGGWCRCTAAATAWSVPAAPTRAR